MKRILLVEDDPGLVELLTIKLELIGYKVFNSNRMDDALCLFRKHDISLVITDYHLQQGSGRRLLNEIKKVNASIPVFLITGTPFVEESDFAGFLFERVFLKPFSFESLVFEINAHSPLDTSISFANIREHGLQSHSEHGAHR